MASEEVSLLSVLGNIVDNRGKTCPTASSGIPLIATNCLRNNTLYPAFEGVRYVSPETYRTWFRGHPESNDLIFVTKGTPGRVCWTPDPVPFCIAQDMVALRPDRAKIDPKYLFAVLRSPNVQFRIEQLHVGTMIPHFKKGDFDKLLLPLPDRLTQEAIGEFYFSLSAKIESNRTTNETLESMARAIFKSWFVDFDPVRAKVEGRQPSGMDAETMAMFPNSFEQSAFGPIPTGWSVSAIAARTKRIQYGFTQSATLEAVGPKFLRITDIQGGRIEWDSVPYCSATDAEHQKYAILPGDILVARTGASTGENTYIVSSPNAVFASYLVRLQFSQPSVARVVAEYLRTSNYFDYIKGVLGGSAQPNASGPLLAGAEMVFPNEKAAQLFLDSVRPGDLLRDANAQQIATLAALRDTLLPKLLSGQLRIRDAEKQVEAQV